MSDPLCSVVVATCNRVFLLNRLLESLGEQDVAADQFEVIVVDDGSRDGTPLLLQSARVPYRLRHFRQDNQGPAAARNLAINNARADVILTLDDDVVATPSLIRRHLELHQSAEHYAATGVMSLPSDKRLAPWLEWEAVTLDKQYQAMIRGDWAPTPRQFYTANASFRRQDAAAAGLFDTTFRRAEDVEMAYRMQDLGVQFEFLPDAVVFHEPNRSYKNWLRVPLLYGRYDVVMWRKGRENILRSVREEFAHYRPAPLRALARLLVGRRLLLNSFISVAGKLAAVAGAAGMGRVCRPLYSAIFNLQYWQGVSEELGGRKAFWQAMDQGSTPSESARGASADGLGRQPEPAAPPEAPS
jgi:glycosyltransferase involved in cell wall biosynthesis